MVDGINQSGSVPPTPSEPVFDRYPNLAPHIEIAQLWLVDWPFGADAPPPPHDFDRGVPQTDAEKVRVQEAKRYLRWVGESLGHHIKSEMPLPEAELRNTLQFRDMDSIDRIRRFTPKHPEKVQAHTLNPAELEMGSVALRLVDHTLEAAHQEDRDRTREAENAALRQQANIDSKTNLPNGPGYELALGSLHRRTIEHGDPLRGVGELDIDLVFFKYLNTIFGHDLADEFLRELPEVMRGYLRSDDPYVLGRPGGDEFKVAIGRITEDEFSEQVKRIQQGEIAKVGGDRAPEDRYNSPNNRAWTGLWDTLRYVIDSRQITAPGHPPMTQADRIAFLRSQCGFKEALELVQTPDGAAYRMVRALTVGGLPVAPLRDFIVLSVGGIHEHTPVPFAIGRAESPEITAKNRPAGMRIFGRLALIQCESDMEAYKHVLHDLIPIERHGR